MSDATRTAPERIEEPLALIVRESRTDVPDSERIRRFACEAMDLHDALQERYEEAITALRDVKAAQKAGELNYRTSSGCGYEAMLAVDAALRRHEERAAPTAEGAR